VNRYDGYHFENFYNQKDNPFSLSNNFTNTILCDKDNEIWIGTLDGLCKYDYTSERFTVFRNIDGDSTSLSNNEITCLAISKNGNVWIGTNNGGLNLYNKKSNNFIRYAHNPSSQGTIASNNIYSLYEDGNGILWIGHFDAGLDYLDLKSGKIGHVSILDNPSRSYGQIRCIYQDNYGNNWIGTSTGLVHYILKSNRFEVYKYDPHSTCSINGNMVNSINCDSENNLWVGTEENGLNIINLSTIYATPNNICFKQIGMQENAYGLSIRSVLSIFKDHDKNIWIGTYSGGINFVSSISLKFQKYQHSPYDPNTIGYPKVWGLCEDKSGNIWVGTDGAGLDKLNPQTNKIQHFRYSKNNSTSISDDAILCAIRDYKNNLWFGTYRGGLNHYNEKSNNFTVYKYNADRANSLPHNDVRVIYEDPQHNLWIGTNGGGLCRYNPDKDNFDIYTPFNSKLTTGNVRAILGDSSGNLYIGTYSRGLDIFNPKTGKTRNFSHQNNQSNSLSDNYVYSLAYAKNGDIWVGTGNGLNLFHVTTGTFEVFNEKHGLANNFIHSILTDKNGDLWVSTNKGISKFLVAEKKFENFDSYDGLQSGEFLDGSAIYARNGLMWFGGINGLNAFNPEKVSKNPFQPKVVITGLQLYNTPVKARTLENSQSPLSKSISITKKIKLNYKQSVFTIDFVGLNYSFPEKTKYAYRIRNLDREWIECGNRRSATYRDLHAGHYTFEVRASNQDGLWTGPTSLDIFITPPFWKTWWAYLIYTSIIALFVYLVYIYNKKQHTLKNYLLLEQVSHQKDLELNQERFRFFTNISHEFRTPLTLILGPVEELIEKEEPNSALGRKLALIFKNARKLLDLINMLLDFRKVETGNMELKVAQSNIVKFSRDLVMGYHDIAAKKNISIQFNASSEHIDVWFDREKFEIIYNNLLSNALKFTPVGGNISVNITERKSQMLQPECDIVEISVADDGIGIAEKHINHIFDSYYSIEHSEGIKGTGIGLALTKSLVEMHKGKIAVRSIEKQGSCFIIEIRKGNSHFNNYQLIETVQETGVRKIQQQLRTPGGPDEDQTGNNISDIDNPEDKKIMLIVEDEPDVRSYIAGNFTEKYNVIEADNGVEGYKLACKFIPDIIISDVMMPEMDGAELCRKIKATVSTSHIPVILLTARTSITHKKEGYETGADSYVTKPFSVDLLGSRVENLLKSRDQLKKYFTRAMLFQPTVVNVESPDDKFIRQLIELIEKNISEPDFDITKLTNELGMSRPVIYRKVKALTDYSIVEFIRTIKMNRAAQLLRTGQYRVSQAAYMVGFNDPKYFTRCFKEQFNINPSDLTRNQDSINPEQV
jgi:ligand-binding sensor domain-containing protein/signal transduction histidine kinase/DNA-binding response OmpR family regulator